MTAPPTDHIPESTLDLYVLKAPEVEALRKDIEAHLAQCAGCARVCTALAEYYEEAEKVQIAEAELSFPSLQVSSRVAPQNPAAVTRSVRLPDLPALRSVYSMVKAHPVRWTAGSVVVVAALMLLIPRFSSSSNNPEYVRADREFLVALDHDGGELWKTFVGAGFDASALPASLSSITSVVDVDGDGRNEVVFMPPDSSSLSSAPAYKTVVCYNANSTIRWRFTFEHPMTFGGESFSGTYDLESPLSVNNPGGGQHAEVIVAGHHSTWWPSVVVRLDAATGKILSEYWHPGWINVLTLKGEKGHLEGLLVTGYSNAFKSSVFALLDSNARTSHAPSTPLFTPEGISGPAERCYALLPDPDIYVHTNPWADGNFVVVLSNGLIEVHSARMLPGDTSGEWLGVVLYFYFDRSLRCVGVKAGDDFASYHHQLEQKGKLKNSLDPAYFEALRKGVQYWNGEKFVPEVNMKGEYLSSK